MFSILNQRVNIYTNILIRIIILIILFIIIIIYFLRCLSFSESFKSYNLDISQLIIPSNIYLTYRNRDCIPSKVFNNFKKYAPNYNIIFYDDIQCLEFIKNNYNSDVVNAYLRLKIKAHKADLFRYCILYKKGGIYLDIKTELLKPINSFINNNYFYTCICNSKKCIYQGILVCKKNNSILKILIDHIVKKSFIKDLEYKIFISFFLEVIQRKCQSYIKPGVNKLLKPDYYDQDLYLFEEKCTKNPLDCYDGLDWRNKCCYIYDHDNHDRLIIKTRYADYPW